MEERSASQAPSSFRQVVDYCRDTITILRDASLLILFLLLVLWPEKVNDILVRAGFEEGSVAGFTWKSKLDNSNTVLQQAEATIADLRAQLEEQRLALENTLIEIDNPEQKQTIQQISDASKDLKDATLQTQQAVTQAIEENEPLLYKAKAQQARVAEPRKYTVGLQTLGVADTRRVEINQALQKKGYQLDSITYSYDRGQRPSWFARNSTVFYYDGSARSQARELAGLMQDLTGQKFQVQLGAGLGVNPNKKDVTLFVHYIAD